MVTERVPLAPLTTLGIGGPATYLAEVTDIRDAADAVQFARRTGLPLLLLGGGSNLLVADAGVHAVVLRTAARGFTDAGDGIIHAEAGASWDGLAAYAAARGLAGIECLSGIPGTAGAAAVQNIGAYGQQLSDTLVSVQVVDLADGSVRELPAAACGLGYRRSVFTMDAAGRYLIWRITLGLRPGGGATLAYADLAHLPRTTPLAGVRAAVLDIRERKGMLAMPGRRGYRSAGSFFTNPVVPASQVTDGAPAWPQPDGTVKLSAAWLIERSGTVRGERLGGAMVSPDHALSIVNADRATATDVVALARRIRDRVREMFGVTLRPEVRFWGFQDDPLAG